MPGYEALAIFATSFVVGLSGAVTPGPLLALDIRESARGGFWAGLYIATGHSVLKLLVVVLLAVGLLRVTEKGPAFTAVALAGGAFLVWMGWGMIRRPAGDLPVVPSEQAPVRRYHPGRPILGGIVFSATNPFWGCGGSPWEPPSWPRPSRGSWVRPGFYVGHILSDYSWFSLVSLAVASGRRVLTPGVYRGLIVVCGMFLWVMAVLFIASGLGRVL